MKRTTLLLKLAGQMLQGVLLLKFLVLSAVTDCLLPCILSDKMALWSYAKHQYKSGKLWCTTLPELVRPLVPLAVTLWTEPSLSQGNST